MTQHDVFYPAIFFEDTEGFYTVQFLDIPGAVTFGSTLSEAFKYAQTALGDALYDQVDLPAPSLDFTHIDLKPTDRIVLISINLNEFRSLKNHKKIKKNTYIPEYLAILAENKNINFSATLSDALEEKLFN